MWEGTTWVVLVCMPEIDLSEVFAIRRVGWILATAGALRARSATERTTPGARSETVASFVATSPHNGSRIADGTGPDRTRPAGDGRRGPRRQPLRPPARSPYQATGDDSRLPRLAGWKGTGQTVCRARNEVSRPMTASKDKTKTDRTVRVTKKGGRIAARVVGGVGAPAVATTLVASLGTASTGTAISTLSGAAATKATLAWLGGGALATGGLGVAGGAVVLGVIAVGGAYGAKKLYDKVTKPNE